MKGIVLHTPSGQNLKKSPVVSGLTQAVQSVGHMEACIGHHESTNPSTGNEAESELSHFNYPLIFRFRQLVITGQAHSRVRMGNNFSQNRPLLSGHSMAATGLHKFVKLWPYLVEKCCFS